MGESEAVVIDPKCACGMTRSEHSGTYVCLNCDGVQPVQTSAPGAPRFTTAHDLAFRREMLRREWEWWPDQMRDERIKRLEKIRKRNNDKQ